MVGKRSRFPKALLASVGLVVAATVVLLASIQLVGPRVEASTPSSSATPEVPDDERPILEPVPDPEPEPEPPPPPPPPEPEPVVGTTEVVEILDLSASGTGVFRDGTEGDAPVAVDEHAVAAFAEEIAVWFDAHLAELQLGGDGTIQELAESSFEPLADPDHLVDEVAYQMRIGVRGAPEWAEVVVTVTREDAILSVVLAVAPGEEPSLLAASPPGSETGETAITGAEDDGRGSQVSAAMGVGR